MKQLVNWATDHLVIKVTTIDVEAEMDYYHFEQYRDLEEVVINQPPGHTCRRVQRHVHRGVRIRRVQRPMSSAAKAPRAFDLAPPEARRGSAKVLRQHVDKHMGGVTFGMAEVPLSGRQACRACLSLLGHY